MKIEDIKIFKKAILNEVEGYEFYKLAAYNVEDDAIKALLLRMANEELDHLEWLKDVFEKLGGNDGDKKTLQLMDMPEGPQIFDWKNVSVKNPSIGVSVIGMGMTFERRSVALYEKAMTETNDEQARAVFKILADWETSHLENFSNLYETYSDAWWAAQDYHPF
jgi:rubrerythrin